MQKVHSATYAAWEAFYFSSWKKPAMQHKPLFIPPKNCLQISPRCFLLSVSKNVSSNNNPLNLVFHLLSCFKKFFLLLLLLHPRRPHQPGLKPAKEREREREGIELWKHFFLPHLPPLFPLLSLHASGDIASPLLFPLLLSPPLSRVPRLHHWSPEDWDIR